MSRDIQRTQKDVEPSQISGVYKYKKYKGGEIVLSLKGDSTFIQKIKTDKSEFIYGCRTLRIR
jgi:hypothetical protein